MATITFNGTRDDLRRALSQIPAILAGAAPDSLGLAQAIQLRAGNAALSKIQQAFVVKSRGGTGEDGIKWAPLAPATIERRRQGPGDRKAMSISSRTSQLTDAQKALYRREFSARKRRLLAQGLPTRQAEALARAQAHNVVRAAGGHIPTRSSILATRQVDILRDTSRLFNSLAAGVEDRPSNAPGQVLETFPGRVIVGTNVEYAAAQHYGTDKIPARPLWPHDGNLPAPWWEAIVSAVRRGVQQAVTMIVAAGGSRP